MEKRKDESSSLERGTDEHGFEAGRLNVERAS